MKLLSLLLTLEEHYRVRVFARGDLLKAYQPLSEGTAFELMYNSPRADLFRLVEHIKFDFDEQCFVVYCDRSR